MGRLRLAHVVQRYRPALLDGSERFMDSISRYMFAAGHSVSILTSFAIDKRGLRSALRGRKTLEGLRVLGRFSVKRFIIHYEVEALCKLLDKSGLTRTSFTPSCLRHYVRLLKLSPYTPGVYREIRSGRYDLVNITPFPLSYNICVYRAIKRSGRGIAYVITPFFHYHLRHYYNPFLISMIREADAVLAFTDYEAAILRRLGARRVHMSAMGLWIDEWAGVKGGEDFLEGLGLSGDYFKIVIPHKSPLKGSCQVLLASILLRRNGVRTAVISFGGATNERYRECVNLARRNGVKVVDLGYISEDFKKRLLASADVLAQPSIADAYGLVYLEAWAVGKPVIAADTLAMRSVVRDGVDGFLVKYNDYRGLADKLTTLARNRELAREMGENGRRKVVTRNNWVDIGRKLEELYKELVEAKR